MALFRLGRSDQVWHLFRHCDDPSLRTEVIHNSGRFDSDPDSFVARLRGETDVSARRALILCLGEFPAGRVQEATRMALAAELLAWYRSESDPGVHGAVDWLLRQRWGFAAELDAADKSLASPSLTRGRDWYVNGQGQTFAVIRGPIEFQMGSTEQSDPDRDADEVAHLRRIGRSFAIATHEVTLAQYARFLDEAPQGVRDVRLSTQFGQEIHSPDCAMGTVTWYDAARYCNWLSAREGLPEDQWCFPGKIGPGMRLPSDYLDRTGYRLPTEAEWEYACRSRSVSSRPFGNAGAWLPQYGWVGSNSAGRMHPVGQKKPNDLGLFDVLGNAMEWCADPYVSAYRPRPGGQATEDSVADVAVSDDADRVIRGFAHDSAPARLRSAQRNGDRPTLLLTFLGFRPARTVLHP
jgi:formylglycine-generating enzyme required for sulfatase activity